MIQAQEQAADPITLEIIKHELVSIPNQVDKNITRTAFSPLINEYKDYAVGIVDAQGRLIAQSRGSLAIFVANALGTAVKDGLELYGVDGLRRGDVVISNHAGTLGQHLNNVVMYTPVRMGTEGEGEIEAFFCVLMHWLDVGGAIVGSCTSTTTTEIYQEGIQFRSVKLIDRGMRQDGMFRMIEHNTRFPEMLLGDVESQIAGCLMGHDMVTEVIGKYGRRSYHSAVDLMWSQAEARVRAAIAAAPDGEYEASSFLDDDGLGDEPVAIHTKVCITGDRLIIDFSGVSAQLKGPLNAGRQGGAVAAARIALKYLFSADEPVNEGDFRPLTVQIPDGTFLSAGPTAAMGSSGSMMPTVVDTILRALAPAFPERVAAAHHGTYGLHTFDGISPATGAPFFHLDTCVGGWGATAAMDGYGPSRSNVHGDTSDVPVEMQEAFNPYWLESYAIRQDSGGAGRRRGGLGVTKTYRVTAPCRLNLKIDRTKCPPWGLQGGAEGLPGQVCIERVGGERLHVLKGEYDLHSGDRVVIHTAGGGGHGTAHEREVEGVRADVEQGYVSVEAAERDYRVAVDAKGRVDAARTRQLRETNQETA